MALFVAIFSILYVAILLIVLKIGSLYFNEGKYFKARNYYKASSKLIPFWNLPRIRIENTNKAISQKEKKAWIEQNLIKLDPQKDLTIISKEIIKTQKTSKLTHNGYLLVALLKNNFNRGIPAVKIIKVTMYFQGKEVAFKENPHVNDFFIVSEGEFAFYFYMFTDNLPHLEIDDFKLQIKVPPFVPNDNVVRIEELTSQLISLKKHVNGSVYYEYGVTLKNNHDFKVDEIYRISLLKYKNLPLERIRCCGPVIVEREPGPQKSLDLNKLSEKQRLSLEPGQKTTIKLELMVEDIFGGYFKPDEVKLTNYFIGVKI